MRPTKVDLTATQGNDEEYRFTFLAESGAPLDVTGYEFTATVLREPRLGSANVATFIVTEGLVPFERVLTLTDAQTAVLPVRTFWYLNVERTVDQFTQVWLAGRLDVRFSPVRSEESGSNTYEVTIGEEIRVVAAGNIGPSGPAGNTGDTGPEGPTGPQGNPGPGLITGGTTGQGLVKASNADFDTEWADPGAHTHVDADIPAGIARDSEVTSAVSTHAASGHLTNEDVDDRVSSLLVAGTNVTLTYNDAANTLTVDAANGLTQEQAEDIVAALIDDNSDLDWTYDDTTGSLVAVIKAGAVTNTMLAGSIALAKLATDPLARANHTGTQTASTVSDFSEAVDDRVGALVTAGTNITVTYDDTAGTLTLAAGSALATDAEVTSAVSTHATNANGHYTTEELQDAVGGMVAGNTETGGTLTYDDTNGKIDLNVTAGGSITYGAAGYPVDVAATEADGTDTAVARADHQHKYAATSITDAHVAAANKDGADSTASMRTLGGTTGQAAPGPLGLTAKGDLVGNSALGRVRVGVGVNGRTLRADSTATPGVAWSGGFAEGGVEVARPTGAVAETVPRAFLRLSNQATLASGSLRLVAIYLQDAQVVTSISFLAGTTAGASLTHSLFGLFDSARARLASTADDTTASWTASTFRTLNLTSPFTITATGLYYVGIMVAGTTVPSLYALEQPSALSGVTPKLHINSNTGLTTTLGTTPAADNGGAGHIPYAYCS